MNRIDSRLAELETQNKKALVAYLVAGDPHIEATLAAMHSSQSRFDVGITRYKVSN